MDEEKVGAGGSAEPEEHREPEAPEQPQEPVAGDQPPTAPEAEQPPAEQPRAIPEPAPAPQPQPDADEPPEATPGPEAQPPAEQPQAIPEPAPAPVPEPEPDQPPEATPEAQPAEAPAEGTQAEPAAEGEAPAEEPATTRVDIEETGPCARLVKITVPAAAVTEEIDKSYEELRKTVFIKGFRRGRTPRHVLERRFADQVLGGVKETLVQDAFQDAVTDNSLRLALAPEIDHDKIALEAGKPLAFEVAVEVAPEFTLDNYRGLSVHRPAVDVTPEAVDHALEAYRMRRGQYTKIDDGQVEETDVPVCHAVALEGGEEIWRSEGLGVSLPSETVGGVKLTGLKDAFLGARPGETRTFNAVTLPDDFQEHEHRGKTVNLEVTIDELRRFQAPEATDEWAESLHFDGLEDLREELYDELRRQNEQQADDTVQNRLAEQLLELTDFDVPEGLIDRIAARMKERMRLELLYRGVAEGDLDQALGQHDARTRETSVRQCKLHFIYGKLAEQEKIFVTEDELQQRIQAIALNYRKRPEEVEAELEQEGRLNALRQQMRDEKVRDFLVQNAQIVEAPAEPAEPAEEPSAAAEPADEPAAETETQTEPQATPEPPADEPDADEPKAEGADA